MDLILTGNPPNDTVTQWQIISKDVSLFHNHDKQQQDKKNIATNSLSFTDHEMTQFYWKLTKDNTFHENLKRLRELCESADELDSDDDDEKEFIICPLLGNQLEQFSKLK
jgi:hypothetical protein